MKYEVSVIHGVNRDIPQVKITDDFGIITIRTGKFLSGRSQILFRHQRKTLLLVWKDWRYVRVEQNYLISC
jgi:hypothetical protein